MTVEDYAITRKIILEKMENEQIYLDECFEQAKKIPFPPNVRPVLPEDIKYGAIIWYHPDHHKSDRSWNIVVNVSPPGDALLTYENDAGEVCSIENAFIEVFKHG